MRYLAAVAQTGSGLSAYSPTWQGAWRRAKAAATLSENLFGDLCVDIESAERKAP